MQAWSAVPTKVSSHSPWVTNAFETTRDEDKNEGRIAALLPSWSRGRGSTFLNEDYCAIKDDDSFVHGLIHPPIVGAGETFGWGVWGSLSRENFETLLNKHDDPKRAELPPMISWLSTQIPEYPDTLNLKM